MMNGQHRQNERSLVQNSTISILVQIVSLLVGLVLGFILPKKIDEYQYSYWQTFVLYVGYVGVLHFGLLDGIVLRYSQYDFDQLDKARLRSQFQILLGSLTGIALLVASFALLFLTGTTRNITVLVAIGIVTKNLVTYNSYSFQITNRISKYAILTIVQRCSYGLIVTFLLIGKVNRFEYYCIAELMGDLIGAGLAVAYNKGMYFGKALPLSDAFTEWRINVGSGIMLMIANWSSSLVIGSAKMVVQWHWDQLTFGKVSFAFSLSNLFLTFVSAISVVLFPQLKRMEEGKLPQIYRTIRDVISPLMFTTMLFFFPGCWILENYLPKYSQSILYLGILLPIIIYTSKVSLLTNNYLKAYRREKSMLRVNLLSVAVAFVLFGFSALLLNSLTAVLICVVFANMFKSVLSEFVVMREIRMNFTKEFVVEAVMTVAFILYTSLFERWTACFVYTVTLIIYFILNRKSILTILNRMLKRQNV